MASSAERAERRGRLLGTGDPGALRASGRPPAVLALHGFGGTPSEVAIAVEVAASLGRRAFAPLLPGHGTHANDLARARWGDWTRAAEAALDEVTREGEPAIVVGLSLGSLIATHLTVEKPGSVRALVLLANAFWLMSPFPAWGLALVDRLKFRDFRLPKLAADIADPEARRNHLTYGEHPVHAAVEVHRAGLFMRERLKEVRVPTLLLHGSRDRVCPSRNAERVARMLGSTDVRVVCLPRSRHVLTRDVERATVAAELRAFFERHG